MMTPEIAFELSLERLEATRQRASLLSTLGQLPAPASLFSFRRRVIPLAGTVEVRRVSDKERIHRRLVELSVRTPARKAS